MTLAPLRHGDQRPAPATSCDTSGLCPNFSGDQPRIIIQISRVRVGEHRYYEHTNLCPAPDSLQIKFQFARHCQVTQCQVIPLILLQNTMQIGSRGSRLQTSICKVASLDHNCAAAWLGWAGWAGLTGLAGLGWTGPWPI